MPDLFYINHEVSDSRSPQKRRKYVFSLILEDMLMYSFTCVKNITEFFCWGGWVSGIGLTV